MKGWITFYFIWNYIHVTFANFTGHENKRSGCNFFSFLSSSSNEIPTCLTDDIRSFLKRNFSQPFLHTSGGVQVFRYTRPSDGRTVCVKKVPKQTWRTKHSFNNEIEILRKITGTGITSDLLCIFDEEDEGSFYYMTRIVFGKLLADAPFYNPRIDNFNFKWAVTCLKMAEIINKLQDKNILILDSQLSNWVQTNEGNLMVMNFGEARKSRLVHDKNHDAFYLGATFERLAEKMVLSTALELGIDPKIPLFDLKKNVNQKLPSQKLIDFPGISSIVNIVKTNVERESTIRKVIKGLQLFIGKYTV